MQNMMHEVESLKQRLEVIEAERDIARQTCEQVTKSPHSPNRAQLCSPTVSPSPNLRQPNTKLLSSLGRLSTSPVRRHQPTKLHRLPDSTLFKQPAASSIHRWRNAIPRGTRCSSIALLCSRFPALNPQEFQKQIKLRETSMGRTQRGFSIFNSTYYEQPRMRKTRRRETLKNREKPQGRLVKSAHRRAKRAAVRPWREPRIKRE